jgi:4-diphosphocytidyl-2-C-methyl-D-erythritol kinase
MIGFPNAKINLGLRILRRRPDGYHDISTCFYPVGWKDALEIIPIQSGTTRFTASGIPVPGDPEDNICLKAYRMMKKDFGLPGVHIHLHKVIPPGGGLGGGSSDAALTLELLSRMFHLYVGEEMLYAYAEKLGSDCPFFIWNKPVMAAGRGEVMEPIDLDLTGKFITIIYPALHVSTAEAYRSVTPALPVENIKDILLDLPIEQWKNELKNDFERVVFERYPVIKDIKEQFYSSGALYASLSGSGASVYGIYDNKEYADPVPPDGSLCWRGRL